LNCGRVKAVGDFKRNSPDQDWISHPNLKSGDLATWQAISQQGSVERYELMRFKKCPRCGAVTTRCGCEDGRVICDGLERCPNERCDQCSSPSPVALSPSPVALSPSPFASSPSPFASSLEHLSLVNQRVSHVVSA
jgi:hypothetical protein